MIAALKRMLRRLTPLELAAHELVVSELELLQAHSGREYAAALVAFNEQRIKRLRAFIGRQTNEEAT